MCRFECGTIDGQPGTHISNDELFADWEGQPALVVDRLDVATVGRLNNG